MVRDTRAILGREPLPAGIMEHWENGTFPMELARLGELGVFGPTIPEEYGGASLNGVCYGLICQELERGDSGLRSFVSVQGSLVMPTIFAYGGEEQKREWLPHAPAARPSAAEASRTSARTRGAHADHRQAR
ncbi:MAG: acyl-CoA dehydrogenase family protein [Planctomycetota bacterium]